MSEYVQKKIAFNRHLHDIVFDRTINAYVWKLIECQETRILQAFFHTTFIPCAKQNDRFIFFCAKLFVRQLTKKKICMPQLLRFSFRMVSFASI